jgi:hypothetical protein
MVEDAGRSRVAGVRSGSEAVESSVAEARWCQSPRFSASLIGLRVRVCGGAVGTVNVGSVPRLSLSFIWRCARGVTATNGRRPRSGASQIGIPRRDPIRR